jgi:hypothetical protein
MLPVLFLKVPCVFALVIGGVSEARTSRQVTTAATPQNPALAAKSVA